MFAATRESQDMLNKVYLRIVIVFVVAITVTTVVGILGLVVGLAQERLNQNAEKSAAHLDAHLHASFASLEAQLFEIAGTTPEFQDNFSTRFHQLVAQTRGLPKLQEWDAIGYAPEIQPEELDKLTYWVEGRKAEFHALGYSDFEVFPDLPDSSTEPLFPGLFVNSEPYRQRTFGYNFYSEPMRRAALRHAFDSRDMTVYQPKLTVGARSPAAVRLIGVVAIQTYDWLTAPTDPGSTRRGVILAALDFEMLLEAALHETQSSFYRLEVTNYRTASTFSICKPECRNFPDDTLWTYQTAPKTVDAWLGDLEIRVAYSEQAPYPTSMFVYAAAGIVMPTFVAAFLLLLLFFVWNQLAAGIALDERRKAIVERNRLVAVRTQLNIHFQKITNAALHELNNVLGISFGHIEAASRKAGLEPEQKKHLEKIEKTLGHIQSLGEGFARFGQMRRGVKASVPIHDFLDDIVLISKMLTETDLDLNASAGTKDCVVRVDGYEIRLAVMNLVFNAIRAVDKSDRRETKLITLWSHVEGDPVPKNSLGTQPLLSGSFIRIGVSDDGIGMNEHQLKLARELGDKPAPRPIGGDGFGLISVKYFVSDHGGMLEIWSEPGIGTTVVIVLPLYTQDEQGDVKADDAEIPL